MAKFEVKAPDGSIYEVNAPEGATEQQAIEYVQKNFAATKQEPPAAVKAGGMLNEIPRQLGLTARYGLEGLANTAQIATEPIRYLQDKLTPEREGAAKSLPLGMIATNFADKIGLPKPENANERVVGDAARLVAGSGGVVGGAQLASKLPGIAGKVFAGMAANPTSQLTAAAGGGLAGGASREAGGDATGQVISSVLGTVVGGLAPGAIQGITARFNALRASPMQLEGKVALALREGGVDWNEMPQALRTQMLAEVKKATSKGGELNPDALRRLADFKLTNTTPTRGMLTLDPVQITREQNLAKIGANTADEGLQGLAQVQNQNNGQLVRNLNDLGASRGNAFTAGQSSIDRITGLDSRMGARVTDLYNQARNMPGGDIPLNRKDLVDNIYSRLAKENKIAFLPKEVSDFIDTISAGTVKKGGQDFEVPFDAKALDNLMTVISTAQRGTKDGNVKAALSAVRAAIDETPITPVKTQYGGNQVVTQAGAQFLRTEDGKAGQFMDALNKAREAARQRFNWQESSKPVEAALGGVEPDKFVQKFVIGGSYKDAKVLAETGDKGAIRDAILSHIKSKATNGAADEVAKFSQSGFNKALRDIGESKMRLYFSPEEIQQIQANARAASYMQFQPVGSAVNNSNSGALMMGGAYDWINQVASKVPMGKQLIVDPLRSIDISLSQRQAQNLTPALLMQQQKQRAASLLGPTAAFGGLLAAPTPVGP